MLHDFLKTHRSELIDRCRSKVPQQRMPRATPDELEHGVEAAHKGCGMSVEIIEPGIFVEGDRHILASAVANLLQNAFKFTHADCHVVLRAYASKGRVLIEVEDEGAGLPEAIAEHLQRPFERHSAGGRGLGLGLSISRKGVEANSGTLSARKAASRGSVFVIDLPQKLMAA